jgi:hypothetical protein
VTVTSPFVALVSEPVAVLVLHSISGSPSVDSFESPLDAVNGAGPLITIFAAEALATAIANITTRATAISAMRFIYSPAPFPLRLNDPLYVAATDWTAQRIVDRHW